MMTKYDEVYIEVNNCDYSVLQTLYTGFRILPFNNHIGEMKLNGSFLAMRCEPVNLPILLFIHASGICPEKIHRFRITKMDDTSRPLQCLKCLAYGHRTDNNDNEIICTYCAQSHPPLECINPIGHEICRNCVMHNRASNTIFRTNHSAMSAGCDSRLLMARSQN